jgi:RNA polymerase-binding transcription factor DksA
MGTIGVFSMATLSTYWSPSDLQAFRQVLIDQHRVLLEQWDTAKRLRDAAPQIGAAIPAGSEHSVGHEHQRNEFDANSTHLGGQVLAFERALKRLYRGVFGVCVHCHQDIAPARLRAQPAAACCHSCHRAHEISVSHRTGADQSLPA